MFAFFKTSLVSACLAAWVAGCATAPANEDSGLPAGAEGLRAEQLMVVDCLLPGQLRQLGSRMTYLTPRRPIKTTASDCEIRGGEYVAFDRSNYATALKIWLPQAKEGDAAAQTYVGEIYEKGLGIQADYQIAAEWYRRAAEQGYSRAQINLGFLYESGLGVERDLTTAMNWYRQASGLSDGNLEFVSSVEAGNRKAKAREFDRLQEENSQLKAQVVALKSERDSRQASLQSSQARLAQLARELEEQKSALAAAQSAAGEEPAASDPQLLARLEEAEREKARLAGRLAAEQLSARELQQSRQQTLAELEQVRQKLAEQRGALALAAQQGGEQAEMQAQLRALQQQVREGESQIARLEAEVGEQEIALARAEAGQRDDGTREALSAELQARDQEVAALRNALAASQAEAGRLAAVEDELADARAEQQRLTGRIADQQLTARQRESARVAELEQQLAAQQAQVQQQQAELAALESQLTQAQVRLDSAPAAAVVATVADGPVIEIIDPPLLATRGAPEITLRSAVAEIEIIGRVDSQLDLLSFRVNDRSAELEDNGLFRVKQSVGTAATPVNLVAIDRDGHRTALEFVLNPKNNATARPQISTAGAAKPPVNVDGVEFGNYYALVIGNNHYPYMTSLNTAANDARVVADILENKYGFNTTLLLDADRYAMLSALNKLRETLTEKDNLLIYYAGHGELDEVNLRGYWLPVDSEPDSSANWISNVAITDILNVMAAKHILVVADSCYSGSMTRSSVARLDTGLTADARKNWYKAMNSTRARAVLTSGGVKPVLDSGGGEHSVFAKAFIDVLNENNSVLEGYKLFREVQRRVKSAAAALNVDQEPQYAPIKYAGHEAGEFFLLPDRSAMLGTGTALY
ncbi:caspase family protein [Granulosicoccaceae sp. 1_MG-2023]|nr:caspase family protein [Granulosicoccaceae sp. 1_MG-2023]